MTEVQSDTQNVCGGVISRILYHLSQHVNIKRKSGHVAAGIAALKRQCHKMFSFPLFFKLSSSPCVAGAEQPEAESHGGVQGRHH